MGTDKKEEATVNPFQNTPEEDAKLKEFSEDQVKAHNKDEDCWIILHGRVYNVSKFMNDHPGGPDVLEDVAGSDATEDFEATFHSKKARDMSKDLLVGKVTGK